MSPSVFPCYAAADRAAATRIAEFLEAGADVRFFLDDGEMRAGEDLVSKARDARTADVALVIFSHHSLPARWTRAQWEGALVKEPAENGVGIAFVTCDDCRPPAVLRPRFDTSIAGLRGLKRWLRTRQAPEAIAAEPELEALGAALADRAGTASAASAVQAMAFAEAFRQDFDAVLALECSGRSLAALSGDVAARLGLRLDGFLKSNLARLRDFCAARRFLVVLANAAPGQIQALTFGGRCSTLTARGGGVPASDDTLARAQAAFAQADATSNWSALCDLARLGRRLMHEQGRMAECFELMQQWQAEAETRGDRAIQDESAREMVWILECWGRVEEARALDYRRVSEFGDQLRLDFSSAG